MSEIVTDELIQKLHELKSDHIRRKCTGEDCSEIVSGVGEAIETILYNTLINDLPAQTAIGMAIAASGFSKMDLPWEDKEFQIKGCVMLFCKALGVGIK